MKNIKKLVAGLSLATASLLYGISTDGTYTNIYGSITNGGNIMSGSVYTNYGVLSQVQNNVISTDSIYTNYAKLEILNSTTTQEVDRTPEYFSFDAKTSQQKDILIESDSITISGVDASTSISISNGEYKIDNGEWTSDNGTVDSGDAITLRVTSSSSYSTKVTASLTVGTSTEDFDVTTLDIPVVVASTPASATPEAKPTLEPEIEDDKESEKEVVTEPEVEETIIIIVSEPIQPEPETTVEEPITDTTTEATVEEPTTETNTQLETNTIDISLPTTDGTTSETVDIPTTSTQELDTGTTISEYKEFEDTTTTTTDAPATKTATYTVEDSNGDTSEKTIVTEVENTTITSTDTGIEIKGTVVSDNGVETTTTTSINDNGLIDIAVENNTNDAVSRISSYQVGGDVETKEDGETAVTFENTNTDNESIELVATASADGTVEHTVTITHADGTVTTSKASSDIPNSKIIVTDDNKIQTIAEVQTDGVDVGIIAQTDDKGERLHIVSFVKPETGEQVTSVVKSSLEGSQTVMNETEIETSVTKEQNGLELRAIATTQLNGETNTLFEIIDIETGEVSTFDPTLDETTPFEANNKVSIESDTNGEMVIRTQTQITREIIFK